MEPPKEPPRSGKEAPNSKPSRLEVARWVIEDYAKDLREFIKKLRKRLH